MVVRFGDFELDRERYELRRDGVPLAVEPQVFDMLAFLVRHRDRVVSRDEIIDAVWEGRIVSEATISTCLKGARQAIGDDYPIIGMGGVTTGEDVKKMLDAGANVVGIGSVRGSDWFCPMLPVALAGTGMELKS